LAPIEEEAGLDPAVWRFSKTEKFLAPPRNQIPDHPAHSLVTILSYPSSVYYREWLNVICSMERNVISGRETD